MRANKISAVLLAAGKGVRFKSDLPKVMHKLIDKPMIYYPLRALLRAGIEDIVVVLGFGAEKVKEYLISEFGEKIFSFVIQKDQKGTGDAVRVALPKVGSEKFIIVYGDMPLIDETIILELMHSFGEEKFVVTSFLTEDPYGYGRIVRDRKDNLLKIVEERDATDLEKNIKEVNAGLYLCSTRLVRKYIGKIKNKNSQREYYFPDIFQYAISDHIDVKILESKREFLLGANNRVELSEILRILQKRINTAHMVNGVTIISPDTVYIGRDVEIGRDTVIYPNVFILGKSEIGSNVVIENGTIIADSKLSDSVTVKAYCYIDKAIVLKNSIIGPFARLRPDTIVEEEVHIGNFVELKKTHIGKGSKANHLAYLGDAEIGDGVNVGAGTITCNYDGERKYKTVLEDGVFVGSDTQLVAPVRIGRNAYIGAGSTITEDVPANSLALSRVVQKNIEGWVLKRKKKKIGR
ncbi:MAG: bifunctional UDP-N-acetylglucosamine diphosphorylase/glucosamine-1-phosphate N-acetyltransferase GlmU [Deltaproteobacteria bacterium]|nr:bifunctional UDP-N-acetylglucosamine diphosphorylase/glucosamine-1-phosphate N-acetyltransferase GlmU [Deltaproteobacteria bacterium]